MVGNIFKNAVDTLTEDDQSLPQVSALLPMVLRGVAVHHSGLLPVLKELVEILFQENLVKLLFACVATFLHHHFSASHHPCPSREAAGPCPPALLLATAALTWC